MTTTIWWIRRDLRLTDNQALHAALAHAEHVIPLFILDPILLASPYTGAKRLAFLFGGLRQLAADLDKRGSRLIVRYGRPQEQLAAVLAESSASAIFAEEDFSPYARRRDAAIAQQLPLRLAGGATVHRPGAVLKANGLPYTVFTPFSRAWKALPLPRQQAVLAAPERISTPDLASDPLPTEPGLPAAVPFPPGEAEAQRRLRLFACGPAIAGYAANRNRLDQDGTSQLSPYLRFGMLSARQMAARAVEAMDNAAGQGAETWLNELIWREFYVSILYHFPQVRGASFRPEYERIPWSNDEKAFTAWTEARTGYPVVDAAMRQLGESGWMHNRARMIVASFLVKDLLIDWRWGERWFMQHLLDGDPAANNGGWQWTAGTGTDAAPYFRVFNPVVQSQKFDPQGNYIRRWLPELAAVPDSYIHTPWEMPGQIQRQAGCRLGHDYPLPIIDHPWAKDRALAAYAQAKEVSYA
ncbi:MAG: deoxyribodipyrimidine photo-lyase [Chloroflexota bacterium]|nr:MAG: deoxyribodipyrimidine photo-lyase [Chloroflexota bacterium]